MITQIELDGFKTFKDFKVELAPFQVIVGPNGSGKSNLFDALRLLSRLAEIDLPTAFQGSRGGDDELFTILPGGKTVDRMRIAVEMLVDRNEQDSGGGEIELVGNVGLRRKVALRYTRLRYELEIILQSDERNPSQLHIVHESLKSIARDEDSWCKKYGLSSRNYWLPDSESEQEIFIDTRETPIAILESSVDTSTVEAKQPIIYLYPDNDRQGRIKGFYASEAQRTVLSRVVDIDYPHALVARQELRSVQFLRLNPEALRQPSSVSAPAFLTTDGRNLPAALARMQAQDEFALTDVSRDMANLVPGILKVRVEKNAASNEYEIWAETSDKRSFLARGLSDGTLRLLAIAALRNDPQFHGVLCFEEPENSVDTLHLKNMTRLLRGMATNFNDPQQVTEPLTQVLITTHSPAFISQPGVIDALLLAMMPTRVGDQENPAVRVTRMVPVITPKTISQHEMEATRDKAVEVYTIDTVKEYLDSHNLNNTREQLKKARTTLMQ